MDEKKELSPELIGKIADLQSKEYFIKFKASRIGQPRTLTTMQDVIEASSARKALESLGTRYDIQELIDIKKL